MNLPSFDCFKQRGYLLHEGIRVQNLLGMCTNNNYYIILLLLFIYMCIELIQLQHNR